MNDLTCSPSSNSHFISPDFSTSRVHVCRLASDCKLDPWLSILPKSLLCRCRASASQTAIWSCCHIKCGQSGSWWIYAGSLRISPHSLRRIGQLFSGYFTWKSAKCAVYFALRSHYSIFNLIVVWKRSILRFSCSYSKFCLFYIQKRIIVRNESINIGDVIKKRRELLGLLQPQLASISGVSTRTIQLVETGKGNPSLDTLIKIADPLGLRINLSLKDPGSMEKIQ